VSAGSVTVPNPDYDPNIPGSPPTITRDYGFGSTKGTVKVGAKVIPGGKISWAVDGNSISFIVPAGTQTGNLTITRGDNRISTAMGVTLTVGGGPVVSVSAGESIQQAINTAPSGSLILVAPGTYSENIIIWKNVKLQGWGAPSTIINASPFPAQKLSDWRTLLIGLIDGGQVDLIPGQDPTFANEEAPGIMVLVKDGVFTSVSKARLDGFTISGANQGGGIFVNAFARYLQITNNRIINNLGNLGGGIRIGTPSLLNAAHTGYRSSFNYKINIHHNQIVQNGGINGGGGINIYNGTNSYKVQRNFICGNFTSLNGAGIAHFGLSKNGIISFNKIIFNEAFYGGAQGGEAGGVLISGEPAPAGAPVTLTPGSGSVVVNANLIQGNLAGSGDGGGIRTASVNGRDILASPDNPDSWYHIRIFNNMVVNNVSGIAGGGIALKDTARIKIINNTISNNYSTSTGINAFEAGALNPSTPHGAGIVSEAHSTALNNAIGTGAGPEFSIFSNPVLYNNIIWRNRSFYFDPSANGGLGDLIANPAGIFQDLQVTGIAGSLDPRNCILTKTTGYDSTNISASPRFVSGYLNQLRTLQVAQEGGNFVSVLFRPLTLTGDYHIRAVSAAINSGNDAILSQFPELQKDYDNENRPQGLHADIGADERQ
jgi:hypothetical protein